MRELIIGKANRNIGSLCLFLKNIKNVDYLSEVLNNIPDGVEDVTLSEKISYYVNNKSIIETCTCGRPKKFIGFKNGWRETCGLLKCVVESREKTCIGKYGVTNPKQSREILDTEKRNILKNWGGKHYMNSDVVRDKFNNTMEDRHGVKWAQQSKEIQDKSKVTWDNNPHKQDIIWNRVETYKAVYKNNKLEIKKKKEKTIIDNWGSNELLYDHINNKIRESSLEKFGTEHHLSSPEVIEKRINTYKDNITNKIVGRLPNDIEYLHRVYNKNKTDCIIDIRCTSCGETSSITRQYLKFRIDHFKTPCLTCFPILSGKSNYEIELLNFIKCVYSGEISSNTKSIVNGELDIYLPELNLAFEFNGLYWHSELYKEKGYHLNKTNQCEEIGINLIHIWEDDWVFRESIVKSIILNKLSGSERIFARKCEVRYIVDNKIVREFLNKNHIQGFVGSKIKIGLFHEDILVSIMTFGSLRKSLNTKHSVGNWELLRFCNSIGYSVVGGASRLLKMFVKDNKPSSIISYSDSSRGRGDMYKVMGFELQHETQPNYYWVIDGLRKHRFNYRKDRLVKEGYDKDKTEIEIMGERGYYRIFDCGSRKWVMNLD